MQQVESQFKTWLMCTHPTLPHKSLVSLLSMSSSKAPSASSSPTTKLPKGCGRSALSITPSSGKHPFAQRTHVQNQGYTHTRTCALTHTFLSVAQAGFTWASSQGLPGNGLQVPIQRSNTGSDPAGQCPYWPARSTLWTLHQQKAPALKKPGWRWADQVFFSFLLFWWWFLFLF